MGCPKFWVPLVKCHLLKRRSFSINISYQKVSGVTKNSSCDRLLKTVNDATKLGD
jgi:hypothetical protein